MAKRRLTREEAAMPTSEPEGVSALPEMSGSPDKDEAVEQESAPPKVKTVTAEGADWLNKDPFEMKRPGLYPRRYNDDHFALRYEDLERHAQFRGTPMSPEDLEVIHSADDTAPQDGVTCPICGELVTNFVRTALIDRETGDLLRNDGVIQYRGQFVAVGPDAMNLTVHGAHPGNCLLELRKKRDRDGKVEYEPYTDNRGNRRSRPVLLPCQSFDQANARAVGVKASILAKRDERATSENAMKSRLGFKVGDSSAHSGGQRDESGVDRGSFAPKTPRGQSRKQLRWGPENVSE